MRNANFLLCIAVLAICSNGCGPSGPVLVPVEGTVRFADGTVPRGEVATIYFEPAPGEENKDCKVASGQIQPDGRFTLMTFRPGDGVILGDYKVLFVIHKTYLGRESLIPSQYTRSDTSPFEVTVTPDGADILEFVLEKP